MLTAVVLLCSVTLTPDLGDCTRNNAPTLIRVPAEFGNPATCFMQAQAYLAGNSVGEDLGTDERIKVVCVRSEIVSASGHHR